jgi:plastocyanin
MITAVLTAGGLHRQLLAQPVTERSPNMEGTWITSPRNLNFQFSHRFEMAGEDADIGDIFGDGILLNYPTFALTYGILPGLMAGVRYSSKSLTLERLNEWQPYLKWSPLRQGESSWSLALTGAYNGAAESLDGEIAAQTELWRRVILLAAARGFTSTFRTDSASLTLAGGVGFRLNRYITLAGDISDIVAGLEDTPLGWSAGLQLGIPYTPHTFSLLVTNVTSGTLQGTSTGVSGEVFWGFEFTVPFSGFARWGKILDPDADTSGEDSARTGRRGTGMAGPGVIVGNAGNRAAVEIEIENFAFDEADLEIVEGTTVRWVNKDPVPHTATDDDGVWGTPLIGPGETFELTFTEAGEYAYHCTPHPYMKAEIRVVTP